MNLTPSVPTPLPPEQVALPERTPERFGTQKYQVWKRTWVRCGAKCARINRELVKDLTTQRTPNFTENKPQPGVCPPGFPLRKVKYGRVQGSKHGPQNEHFHLLVPSLIIVSWPPHHQRSPPTANPNHLPGAPTEHFVSFLNMPRYPQITRYVRRFSHIKDKVLDRHEGKQGIRGYG